MKKWLCMALCVGVMFGTAACGGAAEAPVETQQTEQPQKANADLLVLEVADEVSQVTGKNEWRFVNIRNTSGQFLNGIVEVVALGEGGKELDRQTVFFMNENQSESTYFSTPIGQKIVSCEMNIIRMDATDSPALSPEITQENVYDYLYFTYLPMGEVVYGKATLSGDLNNLTTQYFTGAVTYRVKDGQGNILLEATREYKNLGPGRSETLVEGAIPAEEYFVEYEVVNFEFTDEAV